MGWGRGCSSCTYRSFLVWEFKVNVSGPGLTGHFRDPQLLALYPPFSYHEPSRKGYKTLMGVPYRENKDWPFFSCRGYIVCVLSATVLVSQTSKPPSTPLLGGNARTAPDMPPLPHSLRGRDTRLRPEACQQALAEVPGEQKMLRQNLRTSEPERLLGGQVIQLPLLQFKEAETQRSEVSPQSHSWMVAEPGPISPHLLTQAQSFVSLAGGIGPGTLPSFRILFLPLLVTIPLAQTNVLMRPVTVNVTQGLQRPL